MKRSAFVQLKNLFQKSSYFLVEHVFLFILVLIFTSFFMAAGVFYIYIYSVGSQKQSGINVQNKFEEEFFQEVIREWKSREEDFHRANTLSPRNIFQEQLSEQAQEKELTEE